MAAGTASPPKPALFVPYHDLRARRPARIRRAGRKSVAVSAARRRAENYSRAPDVPLAANRRSDRQTLAALLVPGVLALRRFARTRPSEGSRGQSRRPGHQAIEAVMDAATRTGAGRSTFFIRKYSIGDGDRSQPGKPLEHTARTAGSALVQQPPPAPDSGAGIAVTAGPSTTVSGGRNRRNH